MARYVAFSFSVAILVAVSLLPVAMADSLEELRKAAEQGDAPAQNNLGVMYADGSDMPEEGPKRSGGTGKRQSREMCGLSSSLA